MDQIVFSFAQTGKYGWIWSDLCERQCRRRSTALKRRVLTKSLEVIPESLMQEKIAASPENEKQAVQQESLCF